MKISELTPAEFERYRNIDTTDEIALYIGFEGIQLQIIYDDRTAALGQVATETAPLTEED